MGKGKNKTKERQKKGSPFAKEINKRKKLVAYKGCVISVAYCLCPWLHFPQIYSVAPVGSMNARSMFFCAKPEYA